MSKKTKVSLTKRQSEVLEMIKQHIDTFDKPPTHKVIGQYFGFSQQSAYVHLVHLQGKGAIKMLGGCRGIRVL